MARKYTDDELQYLNPEAYTLISQSKEGFAQAQAAGDQEGMDKYHKQAEEARAQNGYSGGFDGAHFSQLDNGSGSQPQSTQYDNGFSYATAPAYVNRYADKIDALTKDILGSKYSDYLAGDEYGALRDEYTRQGTRAMDDTVGKVSARTGGLASSYAGVAGQEQYNQYMQGLDSASREAYGEQQSQRQQNLELLMALENNDYAKYQQLLSQYNTDRSFNYGTLTDQQANEKYQTEWDYGKEQDALDSENDSLNTVAETALQMAQQGYTLTDTQKKALQSVYGIDDAGIASLAPVVSSGSYTGSYTGGTGDGEDTGDVAELYRNMYDSATPMQYLIANMDAYGLGSYTADKAKQIMSEYSTWLKTGGYKDLGEKTPGEKRTEAAQNAANKIIDKLYDQYYVSDLGGAGKAMWPQLVQQLIESGQITAEQYDAWSKA